MAKKKMNTIPESQNLRGPRNCVRSMQAGVINSDPRSLQHIHNNNLPLVWVDAARLFFRTDKTGSVRFYTMIENTMVEAVRITGLKIFGRVSC